LTPGQRIECLGINIASGDGGFIPPAAGGLALAVGIVWLFLTINITFQLQ
jgi:hypothetical protein